MGGEPYGIIGVGGEDGEVDGLSSRFEGIVEQRRRMGGYRIGGFEFVEHPVQIEVAVVHIVSAALSDVGVHAVDVPRVVVEHAGEVIDEGEGIVGIVGADEHFDVAHVFGIDGVNARGEGIGKAIAIFDVGVIGIDFFWRSDFDLEWGVVAAFGFHGVHFEGETELLQVVRASSSAGTSVVGTRQGR